MNDKGKHIIEYEINWYSYINNFHISYIPKIYQLFEYGYIMEYKKNYIPLYKYLLTIDDINIKKKIIDIIIKNIKHLHLIEKKKENKINFLNNLKKEIYDKVYNRKKIINDLLCFIGPIITVNNIMIDTFEDVMNKCKNIILQYYDTLNNYEYNIIHGDSHMSNILIDNNNKIWLIDPRGYFGNTKLFGVKEYDISKIIYSLSGFDYFNTNEKFTFYIEGNNITLDINNNIEPFLHVFKNPKILIYMTILHWLGLSDYTKLNVHKCVSAFYYGIYLYHIYS
jgi:hypothetical protein